MWSDVRSGFTVGDHDDLFCAVLLGKQLTSQ